MAKAAGGEPGAYAGLTDEHGRWNGIVRELQGDTLTAPLRWRQPRRVFVNSMSDLFHEALPDSAIDRIFAVMMTAHWHTFQVLTKRAERMHAYFQQVLAEKDMQRWINAAGDLGIEVTVEDFPLPNVWLLVSVEDQQRADERIPLLLDTPAVVRGISAEPLLGPINLGVHAVDPTVPMEYGQQFHGNRIGPGGLDWVVVGGESGPGARPCDLAWVRAIVAQCIRTHTPVFVKQLGAWIAGEWPETNGRVVVDRWLLADGSVWVPGVIGEHNYRRPEGAVAFRLFDAKGGNPAEWPTDLRVRQWPTGA